MSVCLGDDVLDLTICDNGRGGLAFHGNGISGMRKRVRALGSTLSIDSPLRHGTVLRVRVPVPARATDAVPTGAVSSADAWPCAGSAA